MNRDNFITAFSQATVTLRSFEEQGELKKSHMNLFDNLLTKLFRRKKYAHDQSLWEELYKRSLYFYQFTNNIKGTPCIFVTKHHDVVPWYARMKIHMCKDTFFRVDSHSDMNPVKDNYKLPQLYHDFLDGNSMALQSINKLVWDIGAALSGIIYSIGSRDFVWGIPSWLPDQDISIKYFLSGKKDKLMVSNDAIAKRPTCEIVFTNRKPKDDSVLHTYYKLQTGPKRNMNKYYKTLCRAIKKNGDSYILDIDLDYFVCNGQPITDKYFKEPFDVQSSKRTQKIIFNQNIPRESMYNSAELSKYSKKLTQEVREVDIRIKHFLKLVKTLKKDGFSPRYISICDSTNIEFEKCRGFLNPDCSSISNGYLPINLALYVHTKVVYGLMKIL
jgi:hypothetical protein